MHNDSLALSGLSQMIIKRACGFPQYMNVTDRKFQKEHLRAKILEHHAISYDAIKEKSKDVTITKMTKNGNILVWLDSIET